MDISKLPIFLFLLIFSFTQVVAEEKSELLFDNDEVLEVQLNLPIAEIYETDKSTNPEFIGQFIIPNNPDLVFDIKATLRGNNRKKRDVCTFPPLKLNFKKKQVKETLMAGQNKLKLVTFCRNSTRFKPFILKEYMAYKIFNEITPLSYKVRLLKVTYSDTDEVRDNITAYSFLIEDVDDLAKRNGLKEIDIAEISQSSLIPEQASIVALFQYLIANVDWSLISASQGKEFCCHNARLLVDSEQPDIFYPVVYDFDVTGFVETPYADTPKDLKIKKITTRRYRGYCIHNKYIDDAIDVFTSKKDEVFKVINSIPELNPRIRKKVRRYVAAFYNVIEDPDDVNDRIIERCR